MDCNGWIWMDDAPFMALGCQLINDQSRPILSENERFICIKNSFLLFLLKLLLIFFHSLLLVNK